jgi:hypothetical protein
MAKDTETKPQIGHALKKAADRTDYTERAPVERQPDCRAFIKTDP